MDDEVVTSPDFEFSWSAWWGGLILSLFLGGIAAFLAGVMASAVKITIVSGLIGAIPGAVLVAISRVVSRKGFGQGMLVGAIVILAIGGLCGAAMSDFSVK